MVALASAFVRVRPELDRPGFKRSGDEAGRLAGDSYGTGFVRGSDGKLRDSRGRFIKESGRAGQQAGGVAGERFSTGFGKSSRKSIDLIKSNLKLAAGVFVPLGLAGAVGEIAKIGIAYEDNLNIFKTVSKATGKQMDEVANKARALGADVNLPGVSAAGAAAAMTELAKAGFSVQDSMDAAKGTLQLARVASISEADAAEIAANAVNAFGVKAKDTGFVVDELAAAANSSSIEISDASFAFKQAAAVFSGLQGPAVGGKEAITELNTAIAILGNNGIKGQDAGTSLKQALLALTAPATRTKNLMHALALEAAGANIPIKDQSKLLNGSTKEFNGTITALDKANPKMAAVGDIAYDASGKMRSLPQIIDLLTRATAGWTQENRNAAITQIFGSDATRSILALMKGGLPTYEAQRKAILQQGAAAQFAAAKNAGLGGAIDNVKSQFENAAISIYNAIKGPLTTNLNKLANVLPKIFDGIGRFSGFVRDNIGVIRDWAVAIGAVTLALKINSAMIAVTAAGGVLNYAKGIKVVTTTTRAWAAAQELLNITLIANPIGAVIVAIVALVAAVVLLYRHNETFRKIVQAVWAAIKTAIGAVVDWIVNTAWPAIVAAYDAVAAAAIWLWKNAIKPAWDGIMAAVRFGVQVVTAVINTAIAVFRVVAATVTWLYDHIFGPVFAAIRKAVEIWWLATQIVLQLFINIVRGAFTNAVTFFRTLFSAVFGFISKQVIGPWWAYLQAVFGAFRTYVLGPILAALNAARAFFARVFTAIAATVSAWWTAHVSPILAAVRAGWNALAAAFTTVYQSKIKPLFELFVSFIKDKVVAGFRAGVALITKAWSAVQEAAKKPVSFVVNHVINPFINGLNRAAAVVGVKDRVEPIKGFASGGKISGAGGISDNRQAVIPGVGAVQLMGGEFVVNRNATARALPLLRWVNDGMRGGTDLISRYLGRSLAQYPGDGSEGWAFKSGGLVGWVDNLWESLSHPVETIKKPFTSLLDKIPGVGLIRDFLIGSARKLLDGATEWLIGSGPGATRAARARAFVQAQDGKPYIWASAGPAGYDCSGIVSAAYNIIKGRSPYSHTFSTESLPGRWFDTTKRLGALIAGWSHPGQSPASATVGHMAGQIAGMPFESTGSTGVRIGNRARSVYSFANTGVARACGGLIPDLLGRPVRLFDSGGFWPPGTLGVNLSGHTEYVSPDGRGMVRNYYITQNVSPTAHPAEVGRQTVLAIQAYERGNGSRWRQS